MIITPLNIFTLPLALVVWTIDGLLWLFALRSVTRIVAPDRYGVLRTSITELTEPLYDWTDHCLLRMRRRPSASWQVWLVLIGALLLARYLFLYFMLKLH